MLTVRHRVTILSFLYCFAFMLSTPPVHARFVNDRPVPELFRIAPLVVTAEVKSVEPLLVETRLSYPSWARVKFHWLRVTCRVGRVLKGDFAGDSMDVAMLAVSKPVVFPLTREDEESRNAIIAMWDPPLMLSPETGQKYVMFLAPSSKKDVYAAIFAPRDEANAIFILDRKSRNYDLSTVTSDAEYRKPYIEKKELVWSLVTESGQLSKAGAEAVLTRYKTEIATKSPDLTIALEWEARTNNQGWTVDVPKDTPKAGTK